MKKSIHCMSVMDLRFPSGARVFEICIFEDADEFTIQKISVKTTHNNRMGMGIQKEVIGQIGPVFATESQAEIVLDSWVKGAEASSVVVFDTTTKGKA